MRSLFSKIYIAFAAGLPLATLCAAQEKKEKEKEEDSGVEILEMPEDVDSQGREGWTDLKKFTDKERVETCRKYNQQYIAFYEKVYFVENCKLREIQNHERINEIAEKKLKMNLVEADVLAKLEAGAPIVESTKEARSMRGCKELEGKYITFSHTDVYVVKGCKKRLFPDWETYVEHKRTANQMRGEILALSWREFSKIPTGEPIPSSIDKEFAKLLSGEAGVEVIPLKQACKGLNGKDVSFVDKLYRIENCRKREYDPEKYLASRKFQKFELQELTAEQWLSLPDGKAMVLPEGKR